MSTSFDMNYKASTTAAAFHGSDAFVRGIMGPIGSGKSVACIQEILIRAMGQAKAPDGFRYTKWLIVRNTYSDLETTTMATWDDWFPEEIFGHRSRKPPYTQKIAFGDVKLEVIFMALDKPADEKKLLSFEPTGIFFNESREIELGLIQAATSRVGRYPKADKGGCTWSGIILDTNPPDDSHWWYSFAVEDKWRYDPSAKRMKDMSEFKDSERWEFFQQPSGLADDAENLENLMQNQESMLLPIEERRKRGRGYYERMIAGKTEEWINVYVHGKYGYIQKGKPVFENYWNDDLHYSREDIKPIPGKTVVCGIDCSGRNPAAVFCQRASNERILVLSELSTEDLSAERFAEVLKRYVLEHYPDNDVVYYGDPAGGWKSQNNDQTYNDVLRSKGMLVQPANDGLRIAPRLEAVKSVCSRLIEGQVGFLVSKGCKVLRKGFNGGYFFKQFNTSGGKDYSPEPDKRGNRCADIHDSLQYALVGMGEVKRVKGRNKSMVTEFADTGFDIYE